MDTVPTATGDMTPSGRRARHVAALVVGVLLLAGSLVGTDHHFPLGPFRMFAYSSRPTGAIRTAALVGVVDGQRFAIRPEEVGLRRAELEGQYDRFREDLRLLEALANVYEEERGIRLDALRLVQRVRRLVDRERVGESTAELFAVWRRADP